MAIDDGLQAGANGETIESQLAAAFEVVSQNGALIGIDVAQYGALWVKAGLLKLRTIECKFARDKDEAVARQAINEFRQTCANELLATLKRTQHLRADIAKMEGAPDVRIGSHGESNELTREEEILLRATLVRLGLLDPSLPIPAPDDFFSGVGGKSRVFLFFLPGEGTGRRLIAKFDQPERAAKEWAAISSLRLLDMPAETILPHPKNEQSDGVIVFPVAHSHAMKRFVSCAQFFRDTLAASPYNSARCLRLALEALQTFYDIQPGQVVDRDSTGHVLTWEAFFGRLPTSDQLQEMAHVAWPDVNWNDDFFGVAEINGRIPNPLLAVASLLKARTGDLRVSRTHGDLNLTNVLVWPDADQTPLKVNLIDLATSQEEQVTASDLAQLEIAIWHEVFFELQEAEGAPEANSLAEFAMVCAFLDGRETNMPELQSVAGKGVMAVVYQLRRWAERILAASPYRSYLLGDYYHCLFFRYLTMLKFILREPTPERARIAILGASLALRVINDQAHGAYNRRALSPLKMPGREIAELDSIIN